MTHAAYALRRGDTSDPEDFRLTHRLNAARTLLRSQGIEPTWVHGTASAYNDGTLSTDGRHICDYNCTCSWPEWIDDEVFEAAMHLANAIQTKRGQHNRREAYALHAEGRR